MTQEAATTRQEHLYNLASLCQALEETLRAAGLTPEQSVQAFQTAVSAECVGCGILISGSELFALSQPPAPERASAKIGRLRVGDCARSGCKACYYLLSFQPKPQLDWPKLLAQVDARQQPKSEPQSRPNLWRLAWQDLWRTPNLLRLGLAVAVIVVLLLVVQWRHGGRIPLLREPENFRVDTVPQEEPAE
jgi:hypothetical protein